MFLDIVARREISLHEWQKEKRFAHSQPPKNECMLYWLVIAAALILRLLLGARRTVFASFLPQAEAPGGRHVMRGLTWRGVVDPEQIIPCRFEMF